METFFDISQGRDRMITFAGNLRRDFVLLEVSEAILEEIKITGACIKGQPHEDAVLCTSSSTYALKHVETTNALLLLPPQQAGGGKVVVEARTDHQLEMSRIAPRLSTLDRMLQECPYTEADEAAEAMQIEPPHPSGSPSDDADREEEPEDQNAGHTFLQLSQQVQASDAELREALKERGAIELSGRWRLVEPSYLGHVLELLLLTACEYEWPRSALPAEKMAELLSREAEINPKLTLHCLAMYGTAGEDAVGGTWSLDDKKVCQYYGLKLLQDQPQWNVAEFMLRWQDDVPEGTIPDLGMLRGEALEEKGELHAFSVSTLPKEPAPRFTALFARQPMWPEDAITPYLAGLEAPGQSAEALLLRFTRASQAKSSDGVTYTAR